MVMIFIERVVRDRNGDPMPGSKAFVHQRLSQGEKGGPLPVYDADGNVVANPAIADGGGVVRLWVDGTSAASILITSPAGDPRLEIETMPNSNVVYEARLKRVEDQVLDMAAAIQGLIDAPRETVDLSGVLDRLTALENRPAENAVIHEETRRFILSQKRDDQSFEDAHKEALARMASLRNALMRGVITSDERETLNKLEGKLFPFAGARP